MKLIPIELLQAYGKPGMSSCYLVRVRCKSGEVFGFTTLNRSFRFDDGSGLVVYSASNELRPQNLQEEANLEVDNTDLIGWFDAAMEALVLSGRFNMAEVTIYRVLYLKPALGFEVVAYGNVGEVEFAINGKSKRKIEFRSLKHQLQQTPNDLYSLTCRNEFGDERCKMPFVWEAGTITAVGLSPYLNLTVAGIARPDGYFELGVVEFLDGDNAGATVEIESWTAAGVIQLSFLTPFPMTGAVNVRLRRDCGKTAAECIAYGNIINMAAEHLTPAQDRSVMVPGAYIKSEGAL